MTALGQHAVEPLAANQSRADVAFGFHRDFLDQMVDHAFAFGGGN